MDRLRKSLRESFRRRKDHTPECSKPHQWQADESAVRAGTCSFQVKYLGCVEVFESRGMQVCEEALKVLRNSRRRPIRGTLYVTGDGLRVVDDETKGLIVDQTIEKVSFCAPDRNHEKGFSYICRDGTTRRWMCHGFLAIKDSVSGERLSHAVGCAFAVCLEKKQKRDKESVMMNFDPKTSTFTRTGSFRQTTMTERIQDAEPKPVEKAVVHQESSDNKGFAVNERVIMDPPPAPPVKAVHNPYAIERPHATPMLLQRQGSFRGFGALNQTSPFKRQLSLRINELPSTLDRQRAMSLESSDIFSCQNGMSVAPIPESSPVVEKDSLSAICQQVSQGLSLLSSDDDDAFLSNNKLPTQTESFRQSNVVGNPWTANNTEHWVSPGSEYQGTIPKSTSNPSDIALGKPPLTSPPAVPLSSLPVSHQQPIAPPRRSSPNFSHLRSQSVGSAEAFYLTAKNSSLGTTTAPAGIVPNQQGPPVPPTPKNPYEWSSQQTSYQIGQGNSGWTNGSSYNASAMATHQQLAHHHQSQVKPGTFSDPFDAEWAAPVAGNASRASTNPFVQNSVKTFEVQM